MLFKFWKLFLLAQNEEKFLNFWLIKSFKPVLQILVKVFFMNWRCLRFFWIYLPTTYEFYTHTGKIWNCLHLDFKNFGGKTTTFDLFIYHMLFNLSCVICLAETSRVIFLSSIFWYCGVLKRLLVKTQKMNDIKRQMTQDWWHNMR